jgi:3-dehydroquinate synthetase
VRSEGVTAEALLTAMRSDKKSRGGVLRFVLLERPGVWHARAVGDEVLLPALESWLSQVREE